MYFKMKNDKKDLFESAPISKAVISLVIPAVISQIIFVIYNIADTFFIGQLGNPDQVAAAALAMPPFVMLTGIANLFGIGGSSLISRCLGQGEREKAKNCSSFCIWTAIIIAFLYGVIMYVGKSFIFPFLGTDASTYDYCGDYLFWTVTIGAVPTVLNASLGHLVRSEGFSKQASAGMALGGILNVILDPVFIFGLKMEIAGAAIATMLSNTAATLYFIILLYKKGESTTITFSPKYYSVKYRIPAEVIMVGLPSLVMIILSTVSSLTTNKLIVSYSNEAVAGMGIAKKLDMFAFGLINGMTQGVLPLIGYNYASKNYDRMKNTIKTAFKYSLIAAVVCTICLYVFAVPISRVFINDAATIEYAQHYLKIIALSCVAITITTMIITIFQATGQKVQPTVLSVVKRGTIDVILMLIMNHLIGVNGIPMATFLADCIAMIISVAIFLPYWRTVKNASGDAVLEKEMVDSSTSVSEESLKNGMVITIGRSYGSGGRTVGKLVAKALGIPYYDSELLEKTAIKSGLNKKFIESTDEKALKNSMIYGYAGYGSEAYAEIEKLASKAQREIIEEVASKGACVIVGRRADKILKNHGNLLSIFISAPIEARIKRVMEREALSENDSRAKVMRVDKERAEYYNSPDYGCWGNADNYDVCLDTDKFGIEQVVHIITELALATK